MDELERAAEHTDIHNIVIDEEASTVYLTDPDMSLDVGSIGKGYAVQKVAEYAKNELGIQYMLFSVGFSDELFCSSFLLHEQNAQRHNAHRAIIIFLFICSPPFL